MKLPHYANFCTAVPFSSAHLSVLPLCFKLFRQFWFEIGSVWTAAVSQ